MAITALNVAATVDYVPTSDPNRGPGGTPVAGSTVFTLGAMDSYVDAHVASTGTSYDLNSEDTDAIAVGDRNVKIKVDLNFMSIEAVRFCLRSWAGFKDAKGNDIPFKTRKTFLRGRAYDVVDPDCLGKIPRDVMTELYAKIIEISKLTAEQEKN